MIKFIKMHGLGNDFIFINKKDISTPLSQDFIQKISHRKTGIGCDQLILYSAIDPKNYYMEIYNADGSSAQMCGNATRCLALYAFEQTSLNSIEITVGNKILPAELMKNSLIKVNMGKVSFDADWIPKINSLADVANDYGLSLKEMLCVDVGNPHIVIFDNHLTLAAEKALGSTLQQVFNNTQGINVSFARINQANVIDLKVWERGVGFTMACGSAACATFAASRKLNFTNNDAIIKFNVGNLYMSWSNDDIIMSGSANKIAEGLYHG